MKGVIMLNEVEYQKIDDAGLHIIADGKEQVVEVDHVVVCAGQESDRSIYDQLQDSGFSVHLIGGADEARELDAKRAIKQASYLAAEI
jgi:2,4-dienoyl-CoA reductase (NADPH2)